MAAAQDYQQVAPKEPAKSTGTVSNTPSPPAPVPAADAQRLILPSLEGIVVVPRVQDVVKTGVHREGIDLSQTPVLFDPALQAQLQAYLGKPLTFGDLHAITQAILTSLRAHGRSLSDVAVPEQDVTTGTVQIVVTAFALGHVKVSGNRYFKDAIFTQSLSTTPGEPIDLDILKADLDWMNRNPFRRVDVQMARGASVGTTDLDITVQDRDPWRVYASFDNTGTEATGNNRWSAGVNLGDVFGRDQQFSYQFSVGDDFFRHPGDARFMAHSASYTIPLSWHGLLEVFGSYVTQRPNVGPFFGQTGHSGQASLRYVQVLDAPRWLSHELQGGFDYKSTDNNLDFGGTSIFKGSQEVDQFLLSYDATVTDDWGLTTFQNDLIYSPGGITGDNTDAAFALSGVDHAKANYLYDTLSLTRAMQLPYNASWIVRAKAQWADGNLLPSEQLGGGGVDSVRGYDTRIANGSEGYLLSQELRSPPFRLLGDLGRSGSDSAQALIFWDYARLNDPHVAAGAPGHIALESGGLGLNYTVGNNLEIRADYGWQFLKLPGTTSKGSRADISVVVGL